MEENLTSKYYLYLDDSGKFKSKNDRHIIYSFVLLDKKIRKKFNKTFEHDYSYITTKKELKGNDFLSYIRIVLKNLKKDFI